MCQWGSLLGGWSERAVAHSCPVQGPQVPQPPGNHWGGGVGRIDPLLILHFHNSECLLSSSTDILQGRNKKEEHTVINVCRFC